MAQAQRTSATSTAFSISLHLCGIALGTGGVHSDSPVSEGMNESGVGRPVIVRQAGNEGPPSGVMD